MNTRHSSETSLCRDRLARYCDGYGIDAGFGGDKIASHAIGVDLRKPYTDVGGDPVQLGVQFSQQHETWDLPWFADSVLDFVFSSHLLEDFSYAEQRKVLAEWWRVLKPGGVLVLYLPDEQRYREYCRETGQTYNQNHSNEDFSLATFTAQHLPGLWRIIHQADHCENYSWEICTAKGLAQLIVVDILSNISFSTFKASRAGIKMADVANTVAAPPDNNQAEADQPFIALIEEAAGLDPLPAPEIKPDADDLTEEAEKTAEESDANPEQEISEDEPSEVEGEEEETDEEVEVEEESDDAFEELPAWVKARIAKAAEQKNEAKTESEAAQAENTALKERLEEAEANRVTLAPTAANPLRDAKDEATIEKWESQMKDAIRGYKKGIRDGYYEQNGEEVPIERLEEWLDWSEDAIRDAPAKQRQYLVEHAASRTNAKTITPDLFKKGTPSNALLDSLVERNPHWKDDAYYPEYTAAIEIGLNVLNGNAKLVPVKSSKPEAEKKTPAPPNPVKASTKAPPSKPTAKKTEADKRMTEALESGDRGLIADALAERL